MAETTADQPVALTAVGDPPSESAAKPPAPAPQSAEQTASASPSKDSVPSAPVEPTPPAQTSSEVPPVPTTATPTPAAEATQPSTIIDKDQDAAPPPAAEKAAATNGAPSSIKKESSKRKSTEPKGKSLKKKQSMRELHLDVEPGQLWWVRMKGYPNWPAIVCDEDMLPPTLLEKRPVSAARTDGSYREDFADGGKNARDRRYPVMFLGTNEFYWQVNTDLMPLDIQEIKEEVGKGERGKKSMALWNAYEIAAEQHELDYFKEILKSHEEQLVQELQEKAEREAKKAEKEAEKQAKKEARKTKGDADGDVDMADADGGSAKKKKAAPKKRKEPASGEGDEEQKGPKKIKIKNKGADEADTESAQKSKKEKKSKPKASKEDTAKSEEPQLTEQQKLEKKEKHILYLRHRLQKGFLSRDHPPKEDEMADMTDHLKSLENDPNLEVSVIRNTKINKVLKAILKIDSIPKEEKYNFKARSTALLSKWNAILGTPAEPAATADTPKPTVNGENHAETAPKSEEPDTERKEDPAVVEKKDEPLKTTNDLGNDAKNRGHVAMTDSKPTELAVAPAAPSAPAAEEKRVETAPPEAAPSA